MKPTRITQLTLCTVCCEVLDPANIATERLYLWHELLLGTKVAILGFELCLLLLFDVLCGLGCLQQATSSSCSTQLPFTATWSQRKLMIHHCHYRGRNP